MKITKLTIQARDGFKLSAVLRSPVTTSRGIIQINGGTGLPKEVYGNFAHFLTQSGFTTITFDCRGIGESKPATLRGFNVNIKDWGQQDLTGIFDWVVTNYPDDKKIIIGHSMGGQLVGLMENNHYVDQLILISSGTGYWQDMSSPYKWMIAPLWFFILPISIYIAGFAPAKYFGQGENIPKGIALDWIKWSKDPRYFERDFGKSIPNIYFDQLEIPLTSFQISDDPLANTITSNKLLKYYSKATVTVHKVTPAQAGREKIGHVGYFSKRSKESLWPNLLNQIKV